MFFRQAEYEIRCEWGPQGVAELAPSSDVVIIVDVFSFTTCVEIAANQGALIYPYRAENARGENAAEFAQSVGAELAAKWGGAGYSLSPHSLLQLPPGLRLVLPSLNGSTLSLSSGPTPTIAGCLRNFQAVAAAAMTYGKRISVIPSGERWWSDGSLRPAYEDWLGAGAILSQLPDQPLARFSPEARAARAAFLDAQEQLGQLLAGCGSAKEHSEQGRADNVALVSAANVSDCVPLLVDGAYRHVAHHFM